MQRRSWCLVTYLIQICMGNCGNVFTYYENRMKNLRMTHCTNSANLDTLVHASSMVIWWCNVLNWHMRTICNMYTCLGWLTLQDRLFVLKDNFLSIFDLCINVFIPVFLFPRYGEVSDYPFSNPPKSIFDVPGVQIGHFTQVWIIFTWLKKLP